MRTSKQHNPTLNRARHAAGFTLLELLLAVMVTAIVSAALFTSLSGAYSARRQIEDHLSGQETARSVLETLRTDLLCVPPAGGRIGGIMIGENASGMMNSDADALTYITANPTLKTDQDLADLRGIEIRLLTSSEDPDHYVLARMVTGNLLATITPEPAVQVLARRVVSLNFLYYDGGEWVDEWDSTERDNALPIAVEMLLVIAPQLSREPEDDEALQRSYITMSQTIRLPAAEQTTGTADGGINLGF